MGLNMGSVRHYGGHGRGIDAATLLRDAGVVGMWEYRLDEGLVYADHAMALNYHVDPLRAGGGLPPEAYHEAIHPEDLGQAIYLCERAIATGTDYVARYRIRVGRDRWREVDVRGRVHLRAGRATRMIGVNRLVSPGQDQDPLNRLSELAVEMVALARQLKEHDIAYFAELMLFQVGYRLADRLKDAEAVGEG